MSIATATLLLSYLDADRGEISSEIEVEGSELARLAKAGRKIVEDGGEFSGDEMDEMDEMDDVQFARLAASSERGADAYSLACSSYLA